MELDISRRTPFELADFGFYGILTDPIVGYERLAELMVVRGVRFVQLRMKHQPRTVVEQTARRLREIVVAPSLFIVNDDPIVARDVGADGVHLGQDDMPLAEAREIVGLDAIIGLSTHSATQTRDACALGPDYIGVGPVFATPTKEVPDPAIGLDRMATMLGDATVPAVVLGGIDHDNAPQVLAAGAINLCAVRAVNQVADPGGALDRFIQLIDDRRVAETTP